MDAYEQALTNAGRLPAGRLREGGTNPPLSTDELMGIVEVRIKETKERLKAIEISLQSLEKLRGEHDSLTQFLRSLEELVAAQQKVRSLAEDLDLSLSRVTGKRTVYA